MSTSASNWNSTKRTRNYELRRSVCSLLLELRRYRIPKVLFWWNGSVVLGWQRENLRFTRLARRVWWSCIAAAILDLTTRDTLI
jgi:hypothetical protein